MTPIICKCKKEILIDDEDFDNVIAYNWSCTNQIYRVSPNETWIPLANQVKGRPPNGYLWDHKDRNHHNNQKDNLRLATHAQNCANRKGLTKNRSGFKGVFYKGKYKHYQVQIRKDKKTYYFGSFKNAEEAARVYDKHAVEFFGEFACLNFPNEIRNNDSIFKDFIPEKD